MIITHHGYTQKAAAAAANFDNFYKNPPKNKSHAYLSFCGEGGGGGGWHTEADCEQISHPTPVCPSREQQGPGVANAALLLYARKKSAKKLTTIPTKITNECAFFERLTGIKPFDGAETYSTQTLRLSSHTPVADACGGALNGARTALHHVPIPAERHDMLANSQNLLLAVRFFCNTHKITKVRKKKKKKRWASEISKGRKKH